MPVKEQPEPENPQAVDVPDAAVDHRVRSAMKSLDDEAGSGYFEAAPNQILTRVETTSMHTETTGNSDDSGLHDIRSLAQNTKRRLSKKVTAQPDSEQVPQGSGSFQMIALPEPAKMVSLPELAALPSKAEIKALDKAAKAAKKAEPAKAALATAAAVEAPVAAAASAAVPAKAAPVVAPAFGARVAPAPANNNTRKIAIIGACVVAAAGVGLFVMTQIGGTKAAAPDPQLALRAPVPLPERAPVAVAAVAPTPPPAPEPVPEAVAPTPPPVEPAPAVATTAHKAAPPKAAAPGARAPKEEVTTAAAAAPAAPKDKATAPQPGDPSFDDLLKEAGVQDGTKKAAAPKLAKKSLAYDDIKNSMGALSSKAQACFKGTQGTAIVKLVVAPSGQVTKASVGGVFAGKPEAACVAGVAQSATFPPWDGGPQTVNYSYLLSE